MATRSFLVTILNSVLAPWHRTGLHLIHGAWSQGSDGIPSEVIPAAHVQGIHIVPGDDWFIDSKREPIVRSISAGLFDHST